MNNIAQWICIIAQAIAIIALVITNGNSRRRIQKVENGGRDLAMKVYDSPGIITGADGRYRRPATVSQISFRHTADLRQPEPVEEPKETKEWPIN